jgi:acyl-CoA synthetase (AMP-forming)/AMP-acid ligase II
MIGLPFMFAEMTARQLARRRDVASLRFCLSCGDVCPIGLQQAFPDVFGIPLHSVWGSTETGPLLHGLQAGPVSRVAPNLQARLVDDRGAPTPRGEVGELLLRGTGVTSGYWTGPGRIDDPKSDGWFATGDLMRQGEGDDLWFVARKKDLIVRGGSNISPVEVERVLLAHAAVRDAAVIGVADDVLGQRVAAHVALVSNAGPDALDDVLAHARAQLADYKVPERLTVVGEIPRNALGKIDRRSLRAMMFDG